MHAFAAAFNPLGSLRSLGANKLSGTLPAAIWSLSLLQLLCEKIAPIDDPILLTSLFQDDVRQQIDRTNSDAHASYRAPTIVRWLRVSSRFSCDVHPFLRNLANNSLTGLIPSFSDQLNSTLNQLCVAPCASRHLTFPWRRRLDDNALSGTIPEAIGHLTALSVLCVVASFSIAVSLPTHSGFCIKTTWMVRSRPPFRA